jgi:DnaD/phage-associated family protein
MANKRMMTKQVTDDDNFMTLSASAQALYLHLNMSADDDGFNNQINLCMFKAHASVDDLKALLEKRYLLQFENGVIVVKHWRMANALRKDRYTPTVYQEELAMLAVKENGAYTFANNVATKRQPDGNQTATQDRLDKNSIDKNSLVKEIDAVPLVDGKDYTQTFWFFEDEFQRPLSQMECERILGYIKEYGEEETLDALRDASIEKKVKWPYIEAILRNRKKEAQA